MATRLSTRKSKLVFTTESVIRDRGRYRQVVIEAQPTFAVIRLHGTRKGYTLTWEAIHDIAAKLEVEQLRRMKAAAKKAKRNG